jgi:glucosamine kinase
LSSLDHLVEHANRVPAPDFSTLTGTVLHCAERGDEKALAVLRKQGEDLAYLVCLVMRRLRHASNDSSWTPPIAITGSILENVPPVRDALFAAVRREFPDVEAPDKGIDPIDGALWRARSGSFS